MPRRKAGNRRDSRSTATPNDPRAIRAPVHTRTLITHYNYNYDKHTSARSSIDRVFWRTWSAIAGVTQLPRTGGCPNSSGVCLLCCSCRFVLIFLLAFYSLVLISFFSCWILRNSETSIYDFLL